MNKISKIISIVTISFSVISAASTTYALEFRANCIEAFAEITETPVQEWTGNQDSKSIVLSLSMPDVTCEIASITEQQLELMCPILSPSDDNPKGLGSVVIRSQGNILNSQADLIIMGSIAGVCSKFKVN